MTNDNVSSMPNRSDITRDNNPEWRGGNEHYEFYQEIIKRHMICYKDKTYCSSDVEEHTCGRELSEEDKKKAEELGLPIAYGEFCEENPCGNPHNNGEDTCLECEVIRKNV